MSESAGQVEDFDGAASKLRSDTPWLAAEDIVDAGGEVKLTIEKCVRCRDATFENGRKEDVYALKFLKAKKMLVLNQTNRRFLADQVSRTAKEWRGATVVLFTVWTKMKGADCLGIRLKLQPGPKSRRK